MAIESNDSNVEVVSGIQLYSGLTNLSVAAVNPTMEQLHALDVKVKQEPVYFVEINGTEYFKVIFWLSNDDLTVRAEFLMNDSHLTNKNGDKNQWVNNIGQDTWSDIEPSKAINAEGDKGTTGEPKYSWWKPEGERKAYSGEARLIKFIQAWGNVASGGQIVFDTMPAIVKGDVTEIRALSTSLSSNQVRVLLGTKENKYQQVYMHYFGRIKPQRDDYFRTALADDYRIFKADYNPTLEYGEWVQPVESIKADPQPAVAEDTDWV